MSSEETLARLRAEFGAESGTFVLNLRIDLTWDPEGVTRLVTAMHDYVSSAEHDDVIERWLAEGFW